LALKKNQILAISGVGGIARPDTRGSRGSLLYALGQLGAAIPLPILAEIITDDSYEAREEALTFIRSNRVECSADEFATAKTALEAASTSGDAETLQAVQRALKFLRAKHYHEVRR
jgi:hypothetical protein